jgi:DNA-binding NarL/FixJ family response regulator
MGSNCRDGKRPFKPRTADEDRKLLDLIEAGNSWTSIAVLLKRSQASVKVRARTLKRRAQKKTAPALASLCRRDG